MDFDNIYKTYRSRIFKYTFNYTKDIQEQEELVQDIFYNIFKALENFKKKSSLNTFIYSISRNVCLNYVKKKISDRKKIEKIISIYEPKFEKSLHELFILSEDVKYFLSVLDKLDKDFKEVFYLSEVENLKYIEISKILNIPVGTVKSRLNRAKEKVIEIITKDDRS